MSWIRTLLAPVLVWFSCTLTVRADPPPETPPRPPSSPLTVRAWIKTGRPKDYPTRILAHLTDFRLGQRVPPSRFGGWKDETRRLDATGFFRTRKIDGRWWLIDPDGYRFLHVAVCSVSPQRGPQFRKAFPGKFDNDRDWARKTVDLLVRHGFNGTGSWSADEQLGTADPRPVYTRKLSFMGSFGKKLRIVRQEPGHLGYPAGLIPVFHPGFEAHCREVARSLADTRDDPYLLGIFSDNELQLPTASLDRHLQLPNDAPGRKAAETWLRGRQDGKLDPDKITEEDRQAWIAHVMDRYFTAVGRAIRSVDPNHLYLGSRLYGADKNRPALWAVAGKHLDAIAVNVYGTWTPGESVRQWEQWSAKPVIITEWYAKGQDSGMKNLSGAGWTVPTQTDRGHFYQHFALSLLESRGCVGWHYFKYADNDPLDTSADPSNRDSNKGIVNFRYEPYTELLDAMQALNRQAYRLTVYFDRAD